MRIWTLALIILRNIELALRDLMGKPFRPYKLLLELTDYCNSKCKTCYIWKTGEDKKNEININDLELSLKNFGPNLLWISLSGGEITLYKDFNELADLLQKNCPALRIITFTTNGLKPQKALECALKLKSMGYDLFVTVSLDGDMKTHDNIRGVDGNYVKAQHTLDLLKKNNVWSHFGLTISDLNSEYIKSGLAHDIHNIRAFSFEHGGGIYKTQAMSASTRIAASIEKLKLIYSIRGFGEIVESIYISLSYLFFKKQKTELPIPCEVISTSLHIRPNGDIKPCMYLPALGNIKKDSLDEVLKSSNTALLRDRAQKGDCEKCWMNCYAPHSIMRHPLLSLKKMLTS